MSTDIRGNVTAEETRQAIRALYRKDSEANLRVAFARALSDDLKPVDENGKWRPSTLLVLGCALLLAFASVFVYFSIGGHRRINLMTRRAGINQAPQILRGFLFLGDVPCSVSSGTSLFLAFTSEAISALKSSLIS